jgi:hypothetical protein
VASKALYEEHKKANALMGGSIDPPMGKGNSEFPTEQAETIIDACLCHYKRLWNKCD